MIEIIDVHKGFETQRVLAGVDLTVHTGESLVVLGPSGSGKSVLLKLIIGLLSPDRGTVRVDGLEVPTLDYDQLARLRTRFGMLFQMAALFDSMTVGENVGIGLREHTRLSDREIRDKVAEKLALVNLSGVEHKKPAELSGGMRKRVGLARAIAMDPDYILYDEPTTGLDPIGARLINILIRDLQAKIKVTSIVVTHDMHSAYYVGDRLCLLHRGRIHFDGTPEEMQASHDPVVRQFSRGEVEGPYGAETFSGARPGPAGARGR